MNSDDPSPHNHPTAITLLGGFEVTDQAERRVGLSPQMKTILALLIAQRNVFVPTSDIIDELWGRFTPRTAINTVQVYISNVRRRMTRCTARGLFEIQHAHGSYQLRLDPDLLDTERFARHIVTARTHLHRGSTDKALEHFASALQLWKSTPLSGVYCGPRLSEYQRSLVDQHTEATQEYAYALVSTGRYAEAIPVLECLLRGHPYREAAYLYLMAALTMVGRRPDALHAYATARHVFREKLGLAPGPELSAMHQRLLDGDRPVSCLEVATSSYGSN